MSIHIMQTDSAFSSLVLLKMIYIYIYLIRTFIQYPQANLDVDRWTRFSWSRYLGEPDHLISCILTGFHWRNLEFSWFLERKKVCSERYWLVGALSIDLRWTSDWDHILNFMDCFTNSMIQNVKRKYHSWTQISWNVYKRNTLSGYEFYLYIRVWIIRRVYNLWGCVMLVNNWNSRFHAMDAVVAIV